MKHEKENISVEQEIRRLTLERDGALVDAANKREALHTLLCVVGLTAFKYESQRAVLQEACDLASKELKNITSNLREQLLTDDAGLDQKPKIVCICGSSRFADIAAVKAWEFEKNGTVALSMNFLPAWYVEHQHPNEKADAKAVQPLAELEQVAKEAAAKTREGWVYDHEKVILTALTTATAKLREENERHAEETASIAVERHARVLIGTLHQNGVDIGDEFDLDAPVLIGKSIVKLVEEKDKTITTLTAEVSRLKAEREARGGE